MRKMREGCGGYNFFCIRNIIGLMGIGMSSAFMFMFLIRATASQRPAGTLSTVQDIAAPTGLMISSLVRHLGNDPKKAKGRYYSASALMLLVGAIMGATNISTTQLYCNDYNDKCFWLNIGVCIIGIIAATATTTFVVYGEKNVYNKNKSAQTRPLLSQQATV